MMLREVYENEKEGLRNYQDNYKSIEQKKKEKKVK